MRWKEKPNMTDTTAAGSDVLPITDVSTDQDRKITLSIIATWAVTKFTTSVAGASQTIVAAINAVRSLANAAQSSANAAQSAASAAQSGVDQNAAAIQQANTAIAQNASGIASLGKEMDNTNDHVSDLEETVNSMDQRIDDAVQQANDATETAIGAANAAGEAAEAVQEIIDQGGTVLSVFGRSGIVEAQAGDYDSAQISHGDGTVADKLAFDATPVVNSKKAVESGGVFTALGGKVNKAGDTIRGSVTLLSETIESSAIYYIRRLDVDENIAPEQGIVYSALQIRDKNNGYHAAFQGRHETNGSIGAIVRAQRNVSGSTKQNELRLMVDTSGNTRVDVVGDGASAAWRTALGIQADSSWTTVSPVMAKKQGNVVSVTATGNYTVAIPAATWTDIATLPAGYRPSTTVYAAGVTRGAYPCVVRITPSGAVGVYSNTESSANNAIRFNMAFII